MANDESHRDPTNLENKLQKHQEFEAEVNANEQRIQNIAQVIQYGIKITQKCIQVGHRRHAHCMASVSILLCHTEHCAVDTCTMLHIRLFSFPAYG